MQRSHDIHVDMLSSRALGNTLRVMTESLRRGRHCGCGSSIAVAIGIVIGSWWCQHSRPTELLAWEAHSLKRSPRPSNVQINGQGVFSIEEW